MIDAHQHFWNLDNPFDYTWLSPATHSPIRRDFLPHHLQPHLTTTGVRQTVCVQTQNNLEETRWALQLAEKNESIAGVVGWVDLTSRNCEDQLLEFLEHPKFVGVRHLTQDEPDDDFIVRPDVLRGLRVLEKHGVPFDLLFLVRHLNHADHLGQLLPDLPMVIDHLAKPPIKDHSLDTWLPAFKAAARHENIFCKLSGLITEADWHQWKPADLHPYFSSALECFGPQRCMFGSDWPVCTLAGSYEDVFNALQESIGPLSKSDSEAIFQKTARRFYLINQE